MISGCSHIRKLNAKNSRVNMSEKIYNQPMRRPHLQSHKDKAREREVFGKICKGISTQLKGLTIDFEQKSVCHDIIKFNDKSILQK